LVWDQDEETAIRAPDGTGPMITWGGPPLAPKIGKNRLHLDIAPPADGDQQAEVERLVALGATRIDVGQGDVSWVVMADPDGNDAIETRQQIVPVLRHNCPHATGRVTLDLSTSGLRRTFKCSTIQESEAGAEAALVASVAKRNDADARAASMIRFWRALGVQAEDTEAGLTWMLAVVKSNFSCDRADNLPFRRDEIADAKAVGEDAEHWLRVEAGWIAGACPDRLDALFNTVTAAGQADAVRVVHAALTPDVLKQDAAA
jgi:hypothetical protein